MDRWTGMREVAPGLGSKPPWPAEQTSHDAQIVVLQVERSGDPLATATATTGMFLFRSVVRIAEWWAGLMAAAVTYRAIWPDGGV